MFSTKPLKILTFSDRSLSDSNLLVKSCKTNNLALKIITPEEEWKVNAYKIKLLHDYLSDQPDDLVLLVSDAFDVYINGNESEILEKFYAFNADLVFAAEANYYFRNPQLRAAYLKNYPKSPTAYRFLNSGTFIGYSGTIKQFLTEIIEANNLDPEDMNSFIPVRSDQYLYAKHFVDVSHKTHKKYTLCLDYHHQLFEVTGGRMRAMRLPFLFPTHAFNAFKIERFLIKLLKLHKYQDVLTDLRFDSDSHLFHNHVTKTTPPIIHIPGSWKFFERIINQLISGRRPFSPLRLLAGTLSIWAYFVSLLIPTKLNM
jgi:hypothetical protein